MASSLLHLCNSLEDHDYQGLHEIEVDRVIIFLLLCWDKKRFKLDNVETMNWERSLEMIHSYYSEIYVSYQIQTDINALENSVDGAI